MELNNEITINIADIKLEDDYSIIDAETIRQISLYCMNADKIESDVLIRKIDPRFQFVGLYPHIVKSYKINPDA